LKLVSTHYVSSKGWWLADSVFHLITQSLLAAPCFRILMLARVPNDTRCLYVGIRLLIPGYHKRPIPVVVLSIVRTALYCEFESCQRINAMLEPLR